MERYQYLEAPGEEVIGHCTAAKGGAGKGIGLKERVGSILTTWPRV